MKPNSLNFSFLELLYHLVNKIRSPLPAPNATVSSKIILPRFSSTLLHAEQWLLEEHLAYIFSLKVFQSKRIFNGNQPFVLETGSSTRARRTTKVGACIFYRRHSVITAVSMRPPSVLFASTALVLLASSLARTGQRPYLSYLSCTGPLFLRLFYAPFSFAR